MPSLAKARPPERGEDLDGDLLMPGLVELHTDHLEAHYVPRPKVHWDPVAAVVSFDGQLATSGITTVLDSLRVWSEEGAEEVDGQAEPLPTPSRRAQGRPAAHRSLSASALRSADAGRGRRGAELDRPQDVRLLSLMDHTPGQRQFRDEGKLRDYYRGKKGGLTDAELDELFARRRESGDHAAGNYRQLVDVARGHDTPLASHDDTTLEHVEDAIRDRVASPSFRPRSRPRKPFTPPAFAC